MECQAELGDREGEPAIPLRHVGRRYEPLGWIQSRPEEASHVLVVVSAMLHNQSTHDDAIMEAELLAGSADRCRAPAHESMVQEFVPEPIKAHGIESLRLVFELPRDQLGDEQWERIKAASCTLPLTTVRGRRCSKDVDLTNSFLDQQFAGKSDAPPIRGYTDVRVQSGTLMDQSFFGSRRRFDEHELW